MPRYLGGMISNNKEQMKVTIWSKNNCIYCYEAKLLLAEKGIPFEERNVDSGNYTREQFQQANPEAKTFPQIWFDDNLIGGYTDLVKYFNK